MIQFSVIGLVLAFNLWANADWDYNVSLNARSRPASVAPNLELGYNFLFWGEPRPGEYRYGFLRPVLRLMPVLIANEGEAMVEVYPISFLRLSGGYYASYRSANATGMACQGLQCEGLLSGPVYSAAFLFGAANIFGFIEARTVQLMISDSRDFGDEYTGLSGKGPADTLNSQRGAIGIRLSDRWNTGVLGNTDMMQLSRANDQLISIFVRYSEGPSSWRFAGGVGNFNSSTLGTGLQLFFSACWLGKASLIPN